MSTARVGLAIPAKKSEERVHMQRIFTYIMHDGVECFLVSARLNSEYLWVLVQPTFPLDHLARYTIDECYFMDALEVAASLFS